MRNSTVQRIWLPAIQFAIQFTIKQWTGVLVLIFILTFISVFTPSQDQTLKKIIYFNYGIVAF